MAPPMDPPPPPIRATRPSRRNMSSWDIELLVDGATRPRKERGDHDRRDLIDYRECDRDAQPKSVTAASGRKRLPSEPQPAPGRSDDPEPQRPHPRDGPAHGRRGPHRRASPPPLHPLDLRPG